jgi:hypothetical protein
MALKPACSARRTRLSHQAFREFPVSGRVQLEEAGRGAEPRGDVLQRVDGEGGGGHRHPEPGRGLGGGEVSVPVLAAQADDADRGEEHRGRQPQAEQVH